MEMVCMLSSLNNMHLRFPSSFLMSQRPQLLLCILNGTCCQLPQNCRNKCRRHFLHQLGSWLEGKLKEEMVN
ncbi:hypothetical protein QQP08_012631 [Theobroma cacao]|nr:hypothetical protein QQP08_012631 [Theobroma cacao]